MWYCKAKFPFEYYVLCNQDGDIIKTSFKEEDLTPLITGDYFIIKKEYKGCKKFSNYSPKNVLDFF
jgi:hypothetical protein